MILVAQLVLTVQAWRNGWKGWALLPIGITLIFGLLLGSVTDDVERLVVPGLICDLLSIGALIGLSVREPRPASVPAAGPQQISAF
jgi:hypothetical protein